MVYQEEVNQKVRSYQEVQHQVLDLHLTDQVQHLTDQVHDQAWHTLISNHNVRLAHLHYYYHSGLDTCHLWRLIRQ